MIEKAHMTERFPEGLGPEYFKQKMRVLQEYPLVHALASTFRKYTDKKYGLPVSEGVSTEIIGQLYFGVQEFPYTLFLHIYPSTYPRAQEVLARGLIGKLYFHQGSLTDTLDHGFGGGRFDNEPQVTFLAADGIDRRTGRSLGIARMEHTVLRSTHFGLNSMVPVLSEMMGDFNTQVEARQKAKDIYYPGDVDLGLSIGWF